jgi:hypothetical protein
MIRPVGLTFDRWKGIQAISAMKKMVATTQHIVPMHEARLGDVYPSRTSAHGLRVTEVHLNPGDPSYV